MEKHESYKQGCNTAFQTWSKGKYKQTVEQLVDGAVMLLHGVCACAHKQPLHCKFDVLSRSALGAMRGAAAMLVSMCGDMVAMAMVWLGRGM